MTDLLEEIKGINRKAASELEKAGFCTNSDIKTLTRNDLHELLPGGENLKVRKKVYDVIHKSPIHAVLKELKSFIPDESLRDALSGNGALLDYLHILKELKSEVNHIQEFIDAHIELLEKISQSQDRSPDKDQAAVTSENHSSAASATSAHTTVTQNNFHFNPQQPHASSYPAFYPSHPSPSYPVTQTTSRPQQLQATVTYKMVVRGNTLDRHVDLLQQLKGPSPATVSLHLQETMHYEESQVIIVFCPVVSRMGTDAEAALSDISSDKPIILVMMHHNHTANSCQPPGPYNNVVLVVNVFFHETVQGLLKCLQNDEAISTIQQKLLEYSTKSEKHTGLFQSMNSLSNLFRR